MIHCTWDLPIFFLYVSVKFWIELLWGTKLCLSMTESLYFHLHLLTITLKLLLSPNLINVVLSLGWEAVACQVKMTSLQWMTPRELAWETHNYWYLANWPENKERAVTPTDDTQQMGKRHLAKWSGKACSCYWHSVNWPGQAGSSIDGT